MPFDSFGTPSYYAVCPKCKRGIGITKNGIIRRHYKGKSKDVCSSSGSHFRTGIKEK